MPDLTQFAFATFIIIGLVNGANLASEGQWNRFYLFLTACIAGLIFGLLHWFNLPSPEIGLAVAVASSGVYKISQNIGK